MLTGPTILILGAGSSVDYGMPIGSQLAADIRSALNFDFDFGRTTQGDDFIAQTLLQADRDRFDARIQAARWLSGVLRGFNSIDDCLYTHGDTDDRRLVGKMAIARCIASAEHASWVRQLWSGRSDEQQRAVSKLWGGWAQRLVAIVATGTRASDRHRLFESLKLVTFNYDRCAETALFHAVKETFGTDDSDAAEIMASLKVYRPYGGLGDLPWPGRRGGEPFGPSSPNLIAMAERIYVYTDDLGERPDLVEMQQCIDQARNVVFLGFGFHTQNMKLLTVPDRSQRRTVLATAHSEPLPRRAAIKERIRAALGVKAGMSIGLQHEGSVELMSNYGVAVTA